jgi:hypothetical protein
MAGRNGAPTMPDESTARVALATCAQVPDLDRDTKTLLFPLARIGIDVRAAVWSDCRVDWGQYDLTVVRSCWDYHENRDRFLAWARTVDHLANPAGVLAWNTDKHYLTQLAGHGIPVVPTTWLEPGGDGDLPTRGRWVVKPAVSLAGLDTGLYDAERPEQLTAMCAHIHRLLAAGQTVMLQPYQAHIERDGETSLIFVEGLLCHAVRRSSILTGPADGADHRFIPAPGQHIDPVRPDAAWVRLAERVLEVVPDSNELLYARVDLVGARNGTVQLMEVELTEPQLFLAHSPPTTARLAQAIAARVTACRPTTSPESSMTMARPGPRGKS